MAQPTSPLTAPLFERNVHIRIWEKLPRERRRQAMTLLADLVRQYVGARADGKEGCDE